VVYGYLAFLVVPGLVALLVGVVVAVLARRDLRLMRAGLMEPTGWEPTAAALRRSNLAAMIPLGLWLGLMAAMVYWLAMVPE
jgi:hypothetical protein